jgi:hypothetical protein
MQTAVLSQGDHVVRCYGPSAADSRLSTSPVYYNLDGSTYLEKCIKDPKTRETIY